jgi:photosystem II stability/assembly factor-like uncharacterized protein
MRRVLGIVMRSPVSWGAAVSLLAAAGLAAAAASGGAPNLAKDEGSVVAPLAERSLLLDVVAVPGAANTLVAVGERGHVLKSTDGGATWQQQRTPTRANLTAVWFADAQNGWAVGHDEVILRTTDGGASWTRTHYEPDRQQPLLDVWFANANEGLAIGAFSAVYRSTDGGATWAPVEFAPQALAKPAPAPKPAAADAEDEELDMADDEGLDQPHLNAIAASSTGKLYVAAEAGHLYRSDDGGATWVELPSPYEGSFFGLLPLDGDSLLVFGLRGHLFRSDDAGATWRKLESGSEALLSGGTRLPDGSVAIAGLAGTVLHSRDAQAFAVHQEADRKGFSAVAPAGNGIVLAGEAGVRALGADVLKR